MRLAFVVQRYGLDIAGGAEYHCRLIAERLSRQASIEVLASCARDYVDWANHYPEGVETLHGVRVRRFLVERPRDRDRFSAVTALVMGEIASRDSGRVDAERVRSATPEAALAWLDEQGPLVPELVRYLVEHEADYDAFVFFSYRYYQTYHGLLAVGDRALLVPTAEDDGVYRLPIFASLFRRPRALAFNSIEERAMLESAAGQGLPGEVVGVGSALPATLDPDSVRRRYGLHDPFLIYVGRIDLNKGCPELLDFFTRYRAETGSRLKLVLVGRSVLPIPEDAGIVALGFLPEAEKWNAIAASMALVIPSRLESLSMVTLEAWWAERPVLASAHCDVLRGQCRRSNAGLYYATYPEFRESLALLEAEAGLRQVLGANGRRYFETHYAWDVIEEKYRELLARVVRAEAA
jgi:glycosyltransferase involved in cell wall biosynthesis